MATFRAGIKPMPWALQPQITEAPEMWRGAKFCMPVWEGAGLPRNIATPRKPLDVISDRIFANFPSWVPTQGGLAVDVTNQGAFDFREAHKDLVGLSQVTMVVILKSDATATDEGIVYSDLGSTSDDRPFNIRYDSQGFSGGGTNLIKYAMVAESGGVKSFSVGESANNTQTTEVQHLVIRWKSGTEVQLFINGVKDIPTFTPAAISGVTPPADADFQGIQFGVGRSNRLTASRMKILFGLIVGEYWSDELIRRHHSDPYAMLRPAGV